MSANTPLWSVAPGSAPSTSAADDQFSARLLTLLADASDLSSSSDELAALCTGWFDQYHISSGRSNVLRAIDLPPTAAVLELGPGGGATTRYLGETCVSVDAFEPDRGLAAVAAARCADLTSVTVRDGWIDEVDRAEAYDVVVALDVLAELDRRGTALTDFVEECRSRLIPGGLLVLGCDNAHGVRYRAGDATPRRRDDETRRPPRVSRDELEQAVRAAGLAPTVLSAFPDHRHARVLFDHDELAALAPELLGALPSFPSPPQEGPHTETAEDSLWSSAITAGTARDSANALVVLASSNVVRRDALASYWSQNRRAALSATNTILPGPDGPVVRRERTFPEVAPADGPLRLRPHTEPVIRGTSLPGALALADDLGAAADLLRAWSDLVDAAVIDDAPVPWDLIPRNVVVLDSGALAVFDQEWELEPTPGAADLVRARGAFWLARDLLFDHGRPSWLPGETVGAAADFILRLVDPSTSARWLETFSERESTHVSHIWLPTRGGSNTSTARRERKNVTTLSNTPPPGQDGTTPVSEDILGVVDSLSAANADLRAENEALRVELRHAALLHRDDTMGLVAASEALKDRLDRAHAQNRRHKARVAALQSQLTAMRASRTWRLGKAVVRPFAVIARTFRR